MTRRFLTGPGVYEQGGRGPLSRRTILRGFLRGAAVAIALPPLEIFFNGNGSAYACGGVIPRRFGIFFWGNGNRPDQWRPTGEGTDWKLSEELAPLANVKDLISVATGLSLKVVNDAPHTSGSSGLLAGVPAAWFGSDAVIGGPTIDQVIAAEIGGETLYRSIQTAATDVNGVSYSAMNAQNPAERSPIALFTRLFGDSFREPGEKGLVDPTLALRRSVLDAVGEDATALRKRLGVADQARLDQHLEGIRELEERLARLEEDPPNLEACERPPQPKTDYPDQDGRPQISARSRAMVDLLTMALACDQTRVFGHYLNDPVGDTLWPGASAGHHQLTHDEPPPQPEVNQITIQAITEFAYLVERFASITEADGTMLDNCAVLACSEISEGQTHSLSDMPLVIAGGACGTLRQGVHYHSYSDENAGKVMLSLIRAMDIPAPSWGIDDVEVTEGLSDLET